MLFLPQDSRYIFRILVIFSLYPFHDSPSQSSPGFPTYSLYCIFSLSQNCYRYLPYFPLCLFSDPKNSLDSRLFSQNACYSFILPFPASINSYRFPLHFPNSRHPFTVSFPRSPPKIPLDPRRIFRIRVSLRFEHPPITRSGRVSH